MGAYDDQARRLRLLRSADDGASWTVQDQPFRQEPMDIWQETYWLAQGRQGELLQLARGHVETEYSPPLGAYLWRSSDAGSSWSQPEDIQRFNPGAKLVGCDTGIDGDLLTLWQRTDRALNVMRSTDNGRTWSSPLLLLQDPYCQGRGVS